MQLHKNFLNLSYLSISQLYFNYLQYHLKYHDPLKYPSGTTLYLISD